MSRSKIKGTIVAFISILLITSFCLIECSKESPTESKDKNDDYWFPPPTGLGFLYRIFESQTESYDGTATVLGIDSLTFPGERYVKVQVGSFTEEERKGFIAWLDLSKINRIGYKGAELYWGNITSKRNGSPKKNGVITWDMLEVFDTPLYVEYTGTTGTKKTTTSSGKYYFDGDMNDYIEVTMSAEYTFSSLNATVTVPYGTVKNCIKLDITFTETAVGINVSFTGEYYLRSDIGLIKGVTIPGAYAAELISKVSTE